jgi:hypothetical protein
MREMRGKGLFCWHMPGHEEGRGIRAPRGRQSWEGVGRVGTRRSAERSPRPSALPDSGALEPLRERSAVRSHGALRRAGAAERAPLPEHGARSVLRSALRAYENPERAPSFGAEHSM